MTHALGRPCKTWLELRRGRNALGTRARNCFLGGISQTLRLSDTESVTTSKKMWGDSKLSVPRWGQSACSLGLRLAGLRYAEYRKLLASHLIQSIRTLGKPMAVAYHPV